jgi:hypothetical protein
MVDYELLLDLVELPLKGFWWKTENHLVGLTLLPILVENNRDA